MTSVKTHPFLTLYQLFRPQHLSRGEVPNYRRCPLLQAPACVLPHSLPLITLLAWGGSLGGVLKELFTLKQQPSLQEGGRGTRCAQRPPPAAAPPERRRRPPLGQMVQAPKGAAASAPVKCPPFCREARAGGAPLTSADCHRAVPGCWAVCPWASPCARRTASFDEAPSPRPPPLTAVRPAAPRPGCRPWSQCSCSPVLPRAAFSGAGGGHRCSYPIEGLHFLQAQTAQAKPILLIFLIAL